MGQLSSTEYVQFKDLLTDLEGVVDDLEGSSQSFVKSQIERHEKYGDRMFISPKQMQWLQDLHEKYVGTVTHSTAKEERGLGDEDRGRDDDMDDEIPF